MPKRKKTTKFLKKHHIVAIVTLSIIWFGLFCATAYSLWQNQRTITTNQRLRLEALSHRYDELSTESTDLIAQQKNSGLNVFSEKGLTDSLARAKNTLRPSQLDFSATYLNDVELLIRYDQKRLQTELDRRSSVATNISPEGQFVTLPILLYHKVPADFESQLQYLKNHGYTTVHMSDVASTFAKQAKLPQKPVVITFDDGFSDQLRALPLLKKYNMEATFYLITAGERSNWCIGIERRPGHCGDSYMNWREVSAISQNPLFEIGAHTINHLSLPAYPAEVQSAEINISKDTLQQRLGKPITTFAYPYGAYNFTTVSLVKQAGFTTAVTTVSGTSQDENSPLTLRRVRNALVLP